MGFYKQREDYNKAFASADAEIKHAQPVSVDDPRLRASFFRINYEEEASAAAEHWIFSPIMLMVGLTGGFVNKKDSIRQANINSLMFLTKLEVDPNNPVEADAISDAYDTTYDVMMRYIKKLWDDYEDDPGCGPFKEIDLSRFKWQQEGPWGDQFYGWSLTFSDETKPSI